MRKAPLVLVFVPWILSVTALEAKVRDKAWEFGAFATHIDADRSFGVDNAIGPEVRFGYNVTARVAAELLWSSATHEITGGVDADFLRTAVVVTGNFLTDRETRFVPYLSAGLGVITATVEAHEDELGAEVLEAFDAGTILTLSFGTRWFFSDNWGARGEMRYNHHDVLEENQDEYVIALGITWVVGGEK